MHEYRELLRRKEVRGTGQAVVVVVGGYSARTWTQLDTGFSCWTPESAGPGEGVSNFLDEAANPQRGATIKVSSWW